MTEHLPLITKSDGFASYDPLAELYDIIGLDQISWWPPSIGVLFIFSVIIIFILVFAVREYRRRIFERTWRSKMLKFLSNAESELNDNNSQKLVREISELVRRIAVHKYSRKICAGLEGEIWLKWLTAHDPQGFDWSSKAKWMISAPYAPEDFKVKLSELKKVINAIRGWIK